MSKYLIIALLMLSACSSATGQMFRDIPPPKKSIVVYHIHQGFGVGQPITVEYNGKECNLHNNSFFVISASSVDLTASLFATPGTSRIHIEANKTKYVSVDNDKDKTPYYILGGLIGAGVASLTSENAGPYKFTIVEPEQAKEELANLHQDCI